MHSGQVGVECAPRVTSVMLLQAASQVLAHVRLRASHTGAYMAGQMQAAGSVLLPPTWGMGRQAPSVMLRAATQRARLELGNVARAPLAVVTHTAGVAGRGQGAGGRVEAAEGTGGG